MSDTAVTWTDEVTDLVRAASGGLLFGIPLLFTVEVLWTGQHTSPLRALVVLLASFVPLVVLNRTEGFRSRRDVRLVDAMMDAVEGVGLGLVLAIGGLVLLGEIDRETPIRIALGKTTYELLPICIGIGVARHILHGSNGEASDGGDESGERDARSRATRPTVLNATVADVGASVIGSVFVALSIAPTDEVPMLTGSRSPLWLLAIMIVSLVVAYAIVFVAGFAGQSKRHAQPGLLQHPITETAVSYVVALLSAAAMLALFQRFDGPWQQSLGQIVVLGLPAAIGGAAGRLAV